MNLAHASPLRRALRWGVVFLVCAGALWLAFHLQDVFNPLLLGLLFAYMLNPLVEAAEARGISRGKAVTVLFGLVFLVLSLGTVYLTLKAAQGLADVQRQLVGERLLDPEDERDRSLIDQALGKPPPPPGDLRGLPVVLEPHPHVAFVRSGSEGFYLDRNDDGERQVGKIEQVTELVSAELGAHNIDREDLAQLARGIEGHASSFTQWGIKLTQGLRKSFSQVGHFFSYLMLVPVYTFFLLMSFTGLVQTARDHLPGAYRAQVVGVVRKIYLQVAAFFRGKLLLCLVKGVVTWIGLWLSGVPFAFAIGITAGFLSIVPFIGPVIAGGLSVFLAYSGQDEFLRALIGIAITLAAAEGVEAVTQPVILGAEVGMNPILLLLSFFVFGELFGLFGLLLAVPIMSVFKTLFEELLLPEIQALAREGPEGEEPGPGPPSGASPPALPTFARAPRPEAPA